jgi:hypothetical protein
VDGTDLALHIWHKGGVKRKTQTYVTPAAAKCRVPAARWMSSAYAMLEENIPAAISALDPQNIADATDKRIEIENLKTMSWACHS